MTATGGSPWTRFPKIGFHSKDGTGAIELTNFRSSALINPAIAWLLSGSANLDKGAFQLQTPKFTQSIDFGPVQETITTNVAGDGSVSTQVKEEIAELGLKAVGAGDGDASSQFQRQGGKGADQSRRRRLQEPQGVRPLGPACGSPRARRPRRPRGGAQGPAQGPGGARPQARRGDRGAEDRRHRVARRDRAGGSQISAWRGECGAAEFDRLQRFGRRIEPAGRPPSAQRRRVDALEDRHRGDGQGHRHHRGGQRVDLRPQSAGRRTRPVRRQRGEGRGRLPELRTGPGRVRALAYRRAGGRRGLLRLDPPRPQQADRGDNDPRAEFRHDDGGGQRLGARHCRPRRCRAWRWPRGSPRAKATAASAGWWNWTPSVRSRSTGSRSARRRTERLRLRGRAGRTREPSGGGSRRRPKRNCAKARTVLPRQQAAPA